MVLVMLFESSLKIIQTNDITEHERNATTRLPFRLSSHGPSVYRSDLSYFSDEMSRKQTCSAISSSDKDKCCSVLCKFSIAVVKVVVAQQPTKS